jgi:hypothetical protein
VLAKNHFAKIYANTAHAIAKIRASAREGVVFSLIDLVAIRNLRFAVRDFFKPIRRYVIQSDSTKSDRKLQIKIRN